MPKRNQIDKSSIQWFCQEYKNGRTVEEMAIDNGWSKQNVKRALAEGQLMYLSWYKTREEDSMLKFLKEIGITSARDLREAFA